MIKFTIKSFARGVGRALKGYLQYYPDFTPRKRVAYHNYERTAKAVERMYADEDRMMWSYFNGVGIFMRRAIRKGIAN